MERRNRSLKALNELVYINSLDDQERADELVKWASEYLTHDISEFDLELEDLKKLSELFFNNLIFLKEFKDQKKESIEELQKLKKYLQNQ